MNHLLHTFFSTLSLLYPNIATYYFTKYNVTLLETLGYALTQLAYVLVVAILFGTFGILGLYTRKGIAVCAGACFVIGFPDENLVDLLKSFLLISRLTFFGVDEIAIFIISPVPGSELYKNERVSGYTNNNEFSFSPNWRKDYKFLQFIKLICYANFLFLKLIFWPKRFFKNFFTIFGIKKFSIDLKMESAPIRSRYYKKNIQRVHNEV